MGHSNFAATALITYNDSYGNEICIFPLTPRGLAALKLQCVGQMYNICHIVEIIYLGWARGVCVYSLKDDNGALSSNLMWGLWHSAVAVVAQKLS